MKNANQNALYFCLRCFAVGFYGMATDEEKLLWKNLVVLSKKAILH